ncbi:MAG TPA: hypothetical protein DCE41_03075 [Cytophagales bacterium]|nr:hypothetical protein [Cytophagales bacterium]HAA24454.1 hypothetical protein [Cytophagales bacterium]HAP59430.1 hypothetical protein [Cytophagales bacterium]
MFSTLSLIMTLSLAATPGDPAPVTAITLPDGGQLVLATTEQYPEIENEISLTRTDAAGNAVWDKTYGGTGYDRASSFIQVDNGDYLILGETSSWGEGNFDVFLLRINAEGEELWKQTYGDEFNDYGHTIQALGNGQYEVRGTQQQCDDHSFDNPCLVLPWVLTIDGNGTLLSDELGENINGNAEVESDEELVVDEPIASAEEEELRIEEAGLLYPNPTTYQLNFRKMDWAGESVSFSIVDLSGRVMDTQSMTLSGGEATLEVSQLPAGAYLLRALSSAGKASQFRFVKE